MTATMMAPPIRGRQQKIPGVLTGTEKAAALMLTLGEKYGSDVWLELDDDEIRDLSHAMASLGPVETKQLEDLLVEFVAQLSTSGAIMGDFERTEKLLKQVLPSDRVNNIMEEIRGPAGRTLWEKLANVQEDILANFLKNEYPQTIAVVLSKIRQDQSAKILGILPEELAMDVINRMLKIETVQKEVLESVESTLRTEFMSNLAQTRRRDTHELMAEIFNSFDRQTEARFMTTLEENNREAAEKIKSLMFTFEDLVKLNAASIQTLLRYVERDKLSIALKGANDSVKDFFLSNMSSRAAKILQDDMGAMGPVRLKDVDEAQSMMVSLAKDLAAKGEIMITKARVDDELVY